MAYNFKIVISKSKFFEDAESFEINRKSDHISYAEFVNYFKNLKKIDKHHLIIGSNFSYGWMPKILNFQSEDFDQSLKIINKAKNNEDLSIEEIESLMSLINNSLVGVSKLLHFVNPEKYPIWDSRVYRYLTSVDPHQYRKNNIQSYYKYLKFCKNLIKDSRFNSIKKLIENKVGYQMSPFRIAELVMYSKDVKNKKSQH